MNKFKFLSVAAVFSSALAMGAHAQTISNSDSVYLLNSAFKCPTEIISALENNKNEILSAITTKSGIDGGIAITTKLTTGIKTDGFVPGSKNLEKYSVTVLTTGKPAVGGNSESPWVWNTNCSINKL